MAVWQSRTWRLPDVGPAGIEALARGCGVSGDDAASLLVLWHGATVVWAELPEDREVSSLVDEVGSYTYEGTMGILAARPIAQASSVAVVLEGGRLSLLRCQADGLAHEAASLPDFAAINVWPLGPAGLVLLCEGGKLQYVDLGAGPKPTSRALATPVEEEPKELDGISAMTLRKVPRGEVEEVGGPEAAFLAAAGSLAGQRAIRVWELCGSKVECLAEIFLPGFHDGVEEGGPTSGQEAAQQGVVIAVDVAPSTGSLCALQLDGTVIVASRTEGERPAWSLCAHLAPYRLAGLRLCAAGGLDEELLDNEEASKDPPGSLVRALHMFEDETLALVFPGLDATAAGAPCVAAPDIVALTPLEPRLLAAMPYEELSMADTRALRIVGCGSAGHGLAFTALGADGGHRLGVLTRAQRSLGKSLGAAVGARPMAVLEGFRELLGIDDLPKFVEASLKYDPFFNGAAAAAPGGAGFGCEQLQRLLERAKVRLREALGGTAGADAEQPAVAAEQSAGWDDAWDVDFEALVADVPAKKPQEEKPAEGDGWEGDGWDVDLDDMPVVEEKGKKEIESAVGDDAAGAGELSAEAGPLQALLARVELQMSRLEVFKRVHTESPSGSSCSLTWADFRETDAASLLSLARRMAAEQCVPALEALFHQQRNALLPHWTLVLDSLPETVPVAKVQRVLPALPRSKADTVLRVEGGGLEWYLRRAQCIVDRTGLCSLALDLMRHAIYASVVGQWPSPTSGTPCPADDLPTASEDVLAARPSIRRLYGMFRLCAEYKKYSTAILQELYLSSLGAQEHRQQAACEALLGAELIALAAFSALAPGARAQLALRRSTAATIAADVREWIRCVSVAPCGFGCSGTAGAKTREELGSPLEVAADAACVAPIEDTIMEALLGRLTSSGWDPAEFRVVAEAVLASSPALPPAERIIRSPLTLLEFILGAVYSDDQRCHALDIFESVDAMYSVIPKADAAVPTGAMATRYAELQQQADELEKHLTCVELLREHKIGLSLSFADLRRGCTNEAMAVRSVWNLFRVLGARYRPALFWRTFQQKLSYLHSHAFAAVPVSSVSEMYVRCLAEQEHFDVMSDVCSEWASTCPTEEVAQSLVSLAQELVNSSPALRHASLEKARRVLRCVPSVRGELAGIAQSELDFIKACELLHDLVHHKPKQSYKWVEDLPKVNPIASLSQVTSAVSAQVSSLPAQMVRPGAAGAGKQAQAAMELFRVDSPVQLRLQMHKPVRVVTDLLQFNPPVLLETEELHTFCKLLGLTPTSPEWAEVMALCGAANLLCGQRGEALSVTEMLLTNAHPSAWKLAMALASSQVDGEASGSTTAAGSPIGSPRGLLALDEASGLLADAAKVCPAEELSQLLGFFDQAARPPEAPAPVPPLAPRGSISLAKARRYVGDGRQTSSFCLLAQQSLGLGEASGLQPEPFIQKAAGHQGLRVWEVVGTEACADESSQRRLGETLLPVDGDTGLALLEAAGGWIPESPERVPRPSPKPASRRTPKRAPRQMRPLVATPIATPLLDDPPTPKSPEASRLPAASSSRATTSPTQAGLAAPRTLASGSPSPQSVPQQAPPAAVSTSVAPATARQLPQSPRDLFPIDFEFDFDDSFGGAAAAGAPPEAQGIEEAVPPEAAVAPLAALAEPSGSPEEFAEREREVYQNMLPSLHSVKAVRAAAARVLHALQEQSSGPVRDSSARVLLCRRMLDMCEEVERAQGLDECPETEPGGGTLTSVLSSMHEACPHLDLSCQGTSLAEEVMRCAEAEPETVPRLIQAVAGVEVLKEVGLSPSALALQAAKREVRRLPAQAEDAAGVGEIGLGLSPLVLWLSPTDAIDLLITTMHTGSIPHSRKMELLGHLRGTAAARQTSELGEEAAWSKLQQAMRQAEALMLLVSVHRAKSTGQAFPRLRLDADVGFEVIRARWLQELAANEETAAFAPCAEAALEAVAGPHG